MQNTAVVTIMPVKPVKDIVAKYVMPYAARLSKTSLPVFMVKGSKRYFFQRKMMRTML